jgi:hypothetical protein
MIFRKKEQPAGPPRESGSAASPTIEHYSFGNMVIDGQAYRDDVKIVNDLVSPDWWRRSGHLVETGDIPDLIQAKPEVLVLGTGASGMMRVDDSVRQAAERERIELVVKPTREASQAYNDLAAKGRSVAAGFHLTC